MILTYSKLGKNGRLGNQLFQIASTLGFAERIKEELKIPVQVVFPKWEYLNDFHCLENYAKFVDVLPTANKHLPEHQLAYIHHDLNGFVDSDCVDVDGYRQSEKYFYKKSVIKSALEIKDCKKVLHVVIHIRRGDYVHLSDVYVDLARNGYYNRAISYIESEYQSLYNYLVVSDDIEFAKTLFVGTKLEKRVAFSKSVSIMDDFRHINSGYIIVCANSSFSWWASYLSNARQIIMPNNWFSRNEPMFDSSTIYPEKILKL